MGQAVRSRRACSTECALAGGLVPRDLCSHASRCRVSWLPSASSPSRLLVLIAASRGEWVMIRFNTASLPCALVPVQRRAHESSTFGVALLEGKIGESVWAASSRDNSNTGWGASVAGLAEFVCSDKQKRRTARRYGVEAVLLFQERYLIDASPHAVAWLRMFFTIGLSCLALPRLFWRTILPPKRLTVNAKVASPAGVLCKTSHTRRLHRPR